MTRISLYIHTLRYLKWRQILFRIYHFLRKKIRLRSEPVCLFPSAKKSARLTLERSIRRSNTYQDRHFTFLNVSRKFESLPDWLFDDYGKLWNYHLHYFDYLNQESIIFEDGLLLINDFCEFVRTNKTHLDPYPTSLRIVNWIKFLTYNEVKDTKIDTLLYVQAHNLQKNLEYHLLGNHLLENGFALMFCGYYFRDDHFYRKAKDILVDELQEQILSDGAHFELSPMYHQILLFRLLDTINLMRGNDFHERELLNFLVRKAEVMLQWLNTMTFANGDIPLLNDCAFNASPTTKELNEYACRLGIACAPTSLHLGESGYRKRITKNYEMVVDIGGIKPDYIPAHAHSDTFTFVLYANGSPFIVDIGTSTYEPGGLRLYQRSTKAHNTVEIDHMDQSEMWSCFRVGKRATIISSEESDESISATHDGYTRIGALHTRRFEYGETSIKITDCIVSNKLHECYAFLHFHPSVHVDRDRDGIMVGNKRIIFKGAEKIFVEDYEYAPEFNKLIGGKKTIIKFSKKLETEIIV